MKVISCIAVAIALPALQVAAQTPKEITEKYFEFFKTGKYAEAAEFHVPKDLAEFRAGFKFAEELPEDQRDQFIQAIFGAEMSIKRFKAMSDAQFYGAFLESTMTKAAAHDEVKIINEKVVSEEIEGECAKVVLEFEAKAAGQVEERADEHELIRVNGKWMIMLPEGLKGFGAILREDFEK